MASLKNVIQDENGKVGVGIVSPEEKIQLHESSSGQNYIKITNDTTGTTGGNGILLGLNSSEDYIIWNYEATNMRFATSGSERMRITSAGRIGIGTTNPAYHIHGSAAESGWGYSFQNATGDEDVNVYLSHGGGYGIAVDSTENATNKYLLKLAGGTGGGNGIGSITRMLVTTAGNVGIGTSSPAEILHIGGGTVPTATLDGVLLTLGSSQYYSASDGTKTIFMGVDVSSYGILGTLTNHSLGLRTNNTERLRIDTSGNVGIGTTSPGAYLEVYGSTASNDVVGMFTGTGQYGSAIHLKATGTNGSNWRILSTASGSTPGGGYFGLYNDSAGLYRFVISPSGNVGIGTTSPTQKLHIGVSTDTISYARWVSTTADLYIGANSTGAHIGVTNGAKILQTGSYPLVIGTTANQELYLGANNAIIATFVDGKMGIGTTSPAATLDVNGNAVFRVSDSQNDTGGFTITNDGAASNVRSWLFNSNPIMLVTSTNAGTPHIGINQSSDTSDGARIYGYKSRGTVSTNSSVANGDEIFTLQAWPMHTAGPNQYKYGGSQTWYKDDNGGTASTYAPVSLRWNMSTSTTTTATVMTLLYNGNLGIGTTSPLTRLTLSSAGDNFIYQTFDRSTGGTDARYWQQGIDTTHGFNWGRATNAGVFTSYMKIDSTGNVGIGTTSPGAKLDVSGEVRSNGGFTNEDGNFTRVLSPGGAAFSSGTTTGAFKITLPMTWSSTMMRMTVKIYDYSDGESFTIELGGYNYSPNSTWYSTFAHTTCDSGTDRNFTVRFGHDGTKNCIYIGELTSAWSYPKIAVVDAEFGHSNFESYRWNDGWDIRMETTGFLSVSSTIQNTQATNWKRTGQDVYYGGGSGRVGIGTTAPTEKLDVYGGKFKLTSGSNGYGWIYGLDVNHSIILRGDRSGTAGDFSNYYQYGGTLANGNGHLFWTGGALANQVLRMQIADDGTVFSGNVGIGTSSPGYSLDVQGNGSIIWATGKTSGGTAIIGCKNSNDGSGHAGADVYLRSSGWGEGFVVVGGHSISAQGGQFNINAGGGSITFNRSGEQMRVTSTGVGIGTTNPGYKLDVSGGAIAIRGNAAGNSLRFDDSGGTSRNAFYVDTSNYLNIGNANYAGVKFVQTASAPTTGEFQGNQIQQAVGDTSNGVILAEPSAWLAVRVGTTDYAIPMYTTG